MRGNCYKQIYVYHDLGPKVLVFIGDSFPLSLFVDWSKMGQPSTEAPFLDARPGGVSWAVWHLA